MMVKWPGVTKPETVNNQYLIIEDIFPSFLEMAGLQEEANKSIDGISFLPLLTENGDYPTERPIYWHFPNTYDQPPYSSVRKGDWKLIYHHTDRKIEVFNLIEDIGEQTNLSETNTAKTKELAGLLTEHLIASKALMPMDKISSKLVENPIDAFVTKSD